MLLPLMAAVLGYKLLESICDNSIKSSVAEPAVGGIVYCDLAFGLMEHSGIYIGKRQIVHLTKSGKIEIISPEDFIAGTTAMSIYTACRGLRPVGSQQAAQRARQYLTQVGKRDYSLLLSNCHIFSSACYSGQLSNTDTILWMLKDTAKQKLGADNWRVWDFET